MAPASPHYWIKEDDISDTGKVLIPTNLYCKPQVDDVIHASVSSRVILNRLPATPEDPNGWVQVERPDKYSETDDFRDYFIGIGRDYLGDFSYDEPEDDITDINDNKESDTDLMVRTGKGSVTITTTKAQEVTIYSANGSCAAKVNMKGGDTQTVSLPSGLYIVNNVKIGVK